MLTNGASRARVARAGAGDDGLVITVPAQPEEVAGARHALGDHLRACGVPEHVVEDLQLVASELVTNGVLHGRPGWVTVEVGLDVPGSVELRVANEGPASAVPAVSEWRSAMGLALTGRGLGIVRQLVDGVEVRGDELTTTVVCTRTWRET